MELMKSNETVRFRTLKVLDSDENVIGKITVCSQPINVTKTEFVAGFAYCSPEDMPYYSKAQGRTIAYRRMMHDRSAQFINLEADQKTLVERLKDIAYRIAMDKQTIWMMEEGWQIV
jgi:hypothetical protein